MNLLTCIRGEGQKLQTINLSDEAFKKLILCKSNMLCHVPLCAF